MIRVMCGFLTLAIAGLQMHDLIHHATAREWRNHDAGAALETYQRSHGEFGWNVDAWREYAHLASASDMDTAIRTIQSALIWEPADAYLWSRLAVLYLYHDPPRIQLATQAARTVAKLAPNTIPIQFEQSLLAARFYHDVSPELRAIWDESLRVAQRDRYKLVRFAIAAQLEISLCDLLPIDAPLARWCTRAVARRARCEADPARLSEMRLRACADAGYRTGHAQ